MKSLNARRLSQTELGCRLSLLKEAIESLATALAALDIAKAAPAHELTRRAIRSVRSAIHYTEGVLASKQSTTHQETV